MQRVIKISQLLVLLTLILLFPLFSFAGTYWVSPTGQASWSNAQSSTPLGGSACASLSTANQNASAGDIIYLRSGTYNTGILPANSGTSGNKIIWEAATGESPVITNTTLKVAATYYFGIYLSGRDYHVFRNLEIDMNNNDDSSIATITNGSDYNEFDSCIMHGGARNQGNSGINIGTYGGTANTNNWIHDCTIYDAGYISTSCNDESNLMKIGGYAPPNSDFTSSNNTIEDNEMYAGGHHLIQTYTEENVIRNNVFHNEGWMDHTPSCDPTVYGNTPDTNGLWGNRCIEVSDKNSRSAVHNLFEGNRFGHAGPPPDGNGATNIEITSPANIVRYNYFFNAGEKNISFQSKSYSSSIYNHVYNNTAYKTRGLRIANYGMFCSTSSNSIVNNIIVNGYQGDMNPGCSVAYGETRVDNNWVTSNGNPKFINTDVSDPTSLTLPDLEVQSSSGVIDNGTYLTQANGSGSSSTTLIVDDALYFQDGTWGSSLSNLQADWIAIGTVTKAVQISSINYNTKTITLASPMTWSNKDPVWLFKDSTGKQVLRGPAPDIGAFEYPVGKVQNFELESFQIP